MVFHLAVLIIILPRNHFVAIFHDGCWLTKFVVVLGVLVGSFWIENGFFHGFMNFCRYVSILFLFYQALLMLIVAYKVNDTLVGNY